ncbi:MAG: hypothetical protein ACRDNF_26075, partial [Streptosporangiaceae bacterium]
PLAVPVSELEVRPRPERRVDGQQPAHDAESVGLVRELGGGSFIQRGARCATSIPSAFRQPHWPTGRFPCSSCQQQRQPGEMSHSFAALRDILGLMRAPKRRRPARRGIARPPTEVNLETLAERASYVDSSEHKSFPSFAGRPKLRADASKEVVPSSVELRWRSP